MSLSSGGRPGAQSSAAGGPDGSVCSSVSELSVAELRDIAARQQAQIEAQLLGLRQRELALARLRKQGDPAAWLLMRQQGLQDPRWRRIATVVEERESRLVELRTQRQQVDEFRRLNGRLAEELAAAREQFQRRTEELADLDRRVEAMRSHVWARRNQPQPQPQQQPQPPQDPQPPSPDSRLSRLREAVLRRRQQAEQLRAKAAAAAGSQDAPTAAPASPPLHRRHRGAAPASGTASYASHRVIASTYAGGAARQPAAEAAAVARYREAARLAFAAASAPAPPAAATPVVAAQAELSVSKDSIEDLIRREAAAEPAEKRRSLVVVQDPPGAPIGWRAPIARQEDLTVLSDASESTASASASATAAASTEETAAVKAEISGQGEQPPTDGTAASAADAAESTTTGEAIVETTAPAAAKAEPRSVTFDPLTVLLDAAMEGDADQIRQCAATLPDVSAGNEEGITALHNAVCAGHCSIVQLLIDLGADVNASDADGWTPLHCSVSCNHMKLTQMLVTSGAVIFCATLTDFETPLDLCQEGSAVQRYLNDEAEKLGTSCGGKVFAAFDYEPCETDELRLARGQELWVLRKGDPAETDWYWCSCDATEGYVPRNFLTLYQRVVTQ